MGRREQAVGNVARRSGSGGGGGVVEDGRGEFRAMFVSLVDPAGLLDMDRCGRTAALMKEAASRSGYGAGIRMAHLLVDVFADTADIVNRPVEDGALHPTIIACREIRAALYDTAVSYREGGGGEPVGDLEALRKSIRTAQVKGRRAQGKGEGGRSAGLWLGQV